MKKLLTTALLVTVNSYAFAKTAPIATSAVELHDSIKSYEMVIDGDVAEKLFGTLDVTPKEVDSEDGGWLNKTANGIVCGQNQKTLEFSCSISVDESGVQ